MRDWCGGALPYWRARTFGGMPVARTSSKLWGLGGCGHRLDKQQVLDSLSSVL